MPLSLPQKGKGGEEGGRSERSGYPMSDATSLTTGIRQERSSNSWSSRGEGGKDGKAGCLMSVMSVATCTKKIRQWQRGRGGGWRRR